MDDTQDRIMTATMALVTEKGYDAMTTRDIAERAGVNECTIFRKFRSKREIVLTAMDDARWRPVLVPEQFEPVSWDLEADLTRFATIYLQQVTPDFARLSIGLRSPQLYEYTAPKIFEIPQVFKTCVREYLERMCERGAIVPADFEALATAFLAINFGFVFFKGSFGDELAVCDVGAYVAASVRAFVHGIVRAA